MDEPIRVVVDLALHAPANLRTREFANYLAHAVERYAEERLGAREALTVTSIRAPEATQTFLRARELYDTTAYAKWVLAYPLQLVKHLKALRP